MGKKEMRGKIAKEEALYFWDSKKPCWEMCRCPESIKDQCPAHKYPFLPCWEIEGTYLKLSDDGSKGDDINICRICRVYRKYGQNKPIRIKLYGKGIDTYCRSLGEKAGVDI